MGHGLGGYPVGRPRVPRGPRLAVPLSSRRPRRQAALLALPVPGCHWRGASTANTERGVPFRSTRRLRARTPAATARPPGWLPYLAIRKPRACQPVTPSLSRHMPARAGARPGEGRAGTVAGLAGLSQWLGLFLAGAVLLRVAFGLTRFAVVIQPVRAGPGLAGRCAGAGGGLAGGAGGDF